MTFRTPYALIAVAVLLTAAATLLIWTKARENPLDVEAKRSPAGFSGIAFDFAGNAYVSARNRNQVLRVSKDHTVSIIAGTGVLGYGGDGGQATAAQLALPMGLAVRDDESLVIADMGNNRIRQIDPGGTIRTIAGDGTLNARSDVLATGTGLYQPVSLSIDAQGDLLIGGSGPAGVHLLHRITGIISNVLGSNLPGEPFVPQPASGPFAATAGDGRDVFVSDSSRNAVYTVDALSAKVYRLAGSVTCDFSGDKRSAFQAHLCFPQGMAYSKEHKLFVADTGNNRVRLIDMDTGKISSIAGNGSAGYGGDNGAAISAALSGPTDVAIDLHDDIYIVDYGNDCIRRVRLAAGTITTWLSGVDVPSGHS